jgi:hypothetical protein
MVDNRRTDALTVDVRDTGAKWLFRRLINRPAGVAAKLAEIIAGA